MSVRGRYRTWGELIANAKRDALEDPIVSLRPQHEENARALEAEMKRRGRKRTHIWSREAAP